MILPRLPANKQPLMGTSILHSRKVGGNDGISHQYVDNHTGKERESTGGLRDNNNSINKSVDETGHREDAEEQFGPCDTGTSSDVDEAQDQEWKDILQIVQVSPNFF